MGMYKTVWHKQEHKNTGEEETGAYKSPKGSLSGDSVD